MSSTSSDESSYSRPYKAPGGRRRRRFSTRRRDHLSPAADLEQNRDLEEWKSETPTSSVDGKSALTLGDFSSDSSENERRRKDLDDADLGDSDPSEVTSTSSDNNGGAPFAFSRADTGVDEDGKYVALSLVGAKIVFKGGADHDTPVGKHLRGSSVALSAETCPLSRNGGGSGGRLSSNEADEDKPRYTDEEMKDFSTSVFSSSPQRVYRNDASGSISFFWGWHQLKASAKYQEEVEEEASELESKDEMEMDDLRSSRADPGSDRDFAQTPPSADDVPSLLTTDFDKVEQAFHGKFSFHCTIIPPTLSPSNHEGREEGPLDHQEKEKDVISVRPSQRSIEQAIASEVTTSKYSFTSSEEEQGERSRDTITATVLVSTSEGYSCTVTLVFRNKKTLLAGKVPALSKRENRRRKKERRNAKVNALLQEKRQARLRRAAERKAAFFGELQPYSIADTPNASPPFYHDILINILLFTNWDLKSMTAVGQVCRTWRFFSNYLPAWRFAKSYAHSERVAIDPPHRLDDETDLTREQAFVEAKEGAVRRRAKNRRRNLGKFAAYAISFWLMMALFVAFYFMSWHIGYDDNALDSDPKVGSTTFFILFILFVVFIAPFDGCMSSTNDDKKVMRWGTFALCLAMTSFIFCPIISLVGIRQQVAETVRNTPNIDVTTSGYFLNNSTAGASEHEWNSLRPAPTIELPFPVLGASSGEEGLVRTSFGAAGWILNDSTVVYEVCSEYYLNNFEYLELKSYRDLAEEENDFTALAEEAEMSEASKSRLRGKAWARFDSVSEFNSTHLTVGQNKRIQPSPSHGRGIWLYAPSGLHFVHLFTFLPLPTSDSQISGLVLPVNNETYPYLISNASHYRVDVAVTSASVDNLKKLVQLFSAESARNSSNEDEGNFINGGRLSSQFPSTNDFLIPRLESKWRTGSFNGSYQPPASCEEGSSSMSSSTAGASGVGHVTLDQEFPASFYSAISSATQFRGFSQLLYYGWNEDSVGLWYDDRFNFWWKERRTMLISLDQLTTAAQREDQVKHLVFSRNVVIAVGAGFALFYCLFTLCQDEDMLECGLQFLLAFSFFLVTPFTFLAIGISCIVADGNGDALMCSASSGYGLCAFALIEAAWLLSVGCSD